MPLFAICLLVFAVGICLVLAARLVRSYPLIFVGILCVAAASVIAFIMGDNTGDDYYTFLGVFWLVFSAATVIASALYFYKNIRGAFWWSLGATLALILIAVPWNMFLEDAETAELLMFVAGPAVFLVVGLLGSLIVPRLIHKDKDQRKHRTNSDLIIGKKLTISKEKEGQSSQRGYLNDVDWAIEPLYPYLDQFKVGDLVKVVKIKGVTLLCVRDGKDYRKEQKEKRKAEAEAARKAREEEKAKKAAEAKKEEPKEEPKPEEPKVEEPAPVAEPAPEPQPEPESQPEPEPLVEEAPKAEEVKVEEPKAEEEPVEEKKPATKKKAPAKKSSSKKAPAKKPAAKKSPAKKAEPKVEELAKEEKPVEVIKPEPVLEEQPIVKEEPKAVEEVKVEEQPAKEEKAPVVEDKPKTPKKPVKTTKSSGKTGENEKPKAKKPAKKPAKKSAEKPAPKAPKVEEPKSILEKIPGRFIVKSNRGYVVSKTEFSDIKSKARVFDDFNDARRYKTMFGGKVIKL